MPDRGELELSHPRTEVARTLPNAEQHPDLRRTCDDGNTVAETDARPTARPSSLLAVSGSRQACQSGCGDRRGHRGRELRRRNTVSDDGCSATCKLEIGYKCTGSSGQKSVCTHTVCGDGNVEGAEAATTATPCPSMAVSEDCQIEPTARNLGCTSKCGDGIVLNRGL